MAAEIEISEERKIYIENYIRSFNHLINEEADKESFDKTFEENESEIENSVINPPYKRTGLVFYEGSIDHYCLWDKLHEETPKRITITLKRLKELGLLNKCVTIKSRKASEQEIQLVHSEEYMSKISNICSNLDPEQLEKESSQYDAVYFTPKTYECALHAVGSVLEMVDHIVEGKISNGFALIRPPGHHAMKDEANGYCCFNNVAIAASYCIKKYDMKRILIVDWDVHHGQGIQRCFYDDERVLYASIHRYENGAFWPELIESNYNCVGDNKSRGFNINVPLNDIGITDTDYLAIWHNLLLPVFYEFNPELVLVSAGYDAAIGCPEGEMLLTPSVYSHFTHYLMGLANGKVGVVLEGGYCLESLSDSVACTIKTLLGYPPIPLRMKYPINQSVVESVLNSISILRSCWDVLKMQKTFNRHDSGDTEEIHKRHYPTLEYKGTVDLLPEKPSSYPTRGSCPVQSDEVKEKYEKAILLLRDHIFDKSIIYTKKRTCLINMPDISKRHAPPETHPERPNRTIFAWRFLEKAEILKRCYVIEDNHREASEELISKCHSKETIQLIKSLENMSCKEIRELEKRFDSVYFTKKSFEVGKLAAGSLLQVVDCVLKNESLNGFACIRPPGHHASRNYPAGFCLFNNIAIAAYYALEQYNLKRILIVDWDIHHGDGTQELVINDERILFISLHRYDHASYYPEKLASNYSIAKNVINVPWNGGPMGDKEYLAAFHNIVMPVAHNFNPELVLVSSGFDSALGDPLGEYQITPSGYGHMTHLLCSLAKGKVIMSLEGGYNLKSIAESMSECVRVLLGDEPQALSFQKELNECSSETIMNVINYQSVYWPCFAFNVDIPESNI